MRNTGRAGKKWLFVEGLYQHDGLRIAKGLKGRWKTTFQLGDFDSKEAAIKYANENTPAVDSLEISP